MGVEERDWHRKKIQDRQRRTEGAKYRNSDNWYYSLDGRWFGPCDKDNIMRLMHLPWPLCLSDSYCYGKDEWQHSIPCLTQLGHTDRNETDQKGKRSQCSVCHIDGNAGAVSYIFYILHVNSFR